MGKKSAKKLEEKIKKASKEVAKEYKKKSVRAEPVKILSEKSLAKFTEANPYYHILNQVIDPELGVGIADMGLIYDVKEKDGLVNVTMTLTSMGCPAGPQLTTDVDGILRLQEYVQDVEIEVVWEPAWNPEMMKEELRVMLFGN